MTRSFVALAGAVLLAAAPAVVHAESTHPQVTLSRNASRVTLMIKAGTLAITETLTPTAFELVVLDVGDEVRVSGDTRGNVSVRRNQRSVAFAMLAATEEDAAGVRALLSGSAALNAFDRLVATDWARSVQPVAVLTSTHALVGALRGTNAPAGLATSQIGRLATPRLTPAQYTPSGCWNTYTKDVLLYTYQLEACLDEAKSSWNPLRSAWCSYEYNLKSTLAFYWLLDCSGFGW